MSQKNSTSTICLALLAALSFSVTITEAQTAERRPRPSPSPKPSPTPSPTPSSTPSPIPSPTPTTCSNPNINTSLVPRDMWSWSSAEVTDLTKQAALISFAESHNIHTIYMAVSSVVSGYVANKNSITPTTSQKALRTLIQTLNSKCMKLEILVSQSKWIQEAGWPSAQTFIKDSVAFINDSSVLQKAVGLHLDIEAHALTDWKIDPATGLAYATPELKYAADNILLSQFFSMMQTLMAISKNGIPVTIDIPNWYDSVNYASVVVGGVVRPAYKWAIDIADRVAIMDYVDFAIPVSGSDGAVPRAATEIGYAASLSTGKTVIIGAANNDNGDPNTSYYQELRIPSCGISYQEQEINLIHRAYVNSRGYKGFQLPINPPYANFETAAAPRYAGIALHSYQSYSLTDILAGPSVPALSCHR